MALHNLCCSDDRGSLIEGALADSPATTPPTARVGITFEPRWPDASLDLLAVVAELRLIERLAPMLPDDDVGVWLRC